MMFRLCERRLFLPFQASVQLKQVFILLTY